ncbi:hypothetical protein BGX34_001024 [Mortierella sp. NVP85]|nr:hypothetical protein BGX34_001024 [Mortierella sp. NVP85]
MSKDFVVPIPEVEEASEPVNGPMSLVDLAARSSRSTRSQKTSDSKKDPLSLAGHDISRIHFTSNKEDYPNKPIVFSGELGYHDPIKVSASHRFTEILMKNNAEEGLYNIRLAVSLDELNIDRIESISFNQRHDDRLGAMEYYTKYELKELKDQLAASGSGMVVLGLHHQYCVEDGFEPRYFIMEIRTTTRPLPLNTPGYIKIHYMELDVTQYETDVDYIDVFDDWDEDLENDPSPLQIAVSYDASRVVLIDAEKKYLHEAPFQVFEFLEDSAELRECDDYIGPDLSSTCGEHIRPDLRHFSGYGKFHFTSTSRDLKDELFITCDGMNVDIFTIDRVYDESELGRVFDEWEHVRRITLAERKEHAILMPRRLIEGLSGKYFHFLARNETQMIGNLETGRLLHSMTGEGTGSLSRDGSMMLIHEFPNIITTRWTGSGTILGQTDVSRGYLYSSGPSFIRDDNYVLIPISKPDDTYGKGRLGMVLDTPTLSVPERVSYTSRYHEQLPQNAGDRGQFLYSSHGSKLDMLRLQDILVAPYPQSKYLCDDECLEVSADLDGSGVLWESEDVETVTIDDLTIIVGFEEVAEGQYAVFVSVANSQGESRQVIQIPPLRIGDITTKYGIHVDRANLQLFVVCDLFAMVWKLPTTFSGDVALQSCLWTRLFYYKDAMDELEVAETMVYPTTLIVCNHGRIVVTSKNELGEPPRPNDGFNKSAKPKPGKKKVVKHVRIADGTGKSEIGSTRPESELKTDGGYPITKERKKKERRPRGTKGRPPQSKLKSVKSKDELSKENMKEEQKYRIPAPESTTFPLYSDGSFSRDPFRFFNGLFMLMHMFRASNEPLRQAILKYVGLHINRTVECNGRTLTILRTICRRVKDVNYTLTEIFLKAIFNSSHVRWVPMPNRVRYLNPISLLLRRCEELPRAINLAQIVINYCLRVSKKEEDPHFSLPVLNSLHELFKLKERPPDLITNVLRALAYCTVPEKTFIIDHAIIAHPPTFRGLFGTPKKQPIYAYQDPVFKLDRSMLYMEHDPLNENFTRDLFVASFDMLWRSPDLEQEENERTPLERITDYGPIPSPSWIRVLYYFHLCKIMPRTDRRIEFYDLPLEALDNPAIAALIEYKWNTIGYKYWLVRFCWQFVFYIMILVAVLLQVYDPTQGYSLKGVFIAIIVMGAIFLVLELRQFFSNPRRYVTSPYNVVDLLVFGVPLAGSVIQVVNIDTDNNHGHKATLSFSVLFVFLHILFELRVNQNVCRFVAIIVRIVGKIQVFFLIFAAGIIAFSIAILHLIRGCTVGVCDTTGIKFSDDIYRAIASTYFFMGGIWDPVEDQFENGPNSFLFMIIMYFFFTTILLLNVLIDYRETHHDIFPKKIYYFGTRKEQKEYRDKYSDGHEDDTGARDGSSNSTGAGLGTLILPNALSKHGSNSSSSGIMTRQSRMTELKAIKQSQEEMKQEMKKEMQHSHDQIRALQEQLADLTATLNRVLLLNDPSRQ